MESDSKFDEKVKELMWYSIGFEMYKNEDFNYSFTKLKAIHYVYILEKDNSQIYIGHSKNIYSRIVQHKMSFDFDTFYLIEYDHYNVLNVEREWIKLLQPKYNIRSRK